MDEAFILTPLFPPAAPLSGAEALFLTGTPWTRMFRQAGHTPPHQRFARRDENYLVGEAVRTNSLGHVARPKGGCRLRARLDVRRGLNAARPSHAMHSLGLSMSRKRAPWLPKAGPCFDSTTRQDMFWGRAGMNARPRWGKRAVYAALNSCSTPPTVAPRANAIPLPFGTHQDNRLRSSHMLVASPAAPAPTS